MTSVSLYSSSFLEISLAPTDRYLHLNWLGTQTEASIRTGCEKYIELMVEHQAFLLLNDNSQLQGGWLTSCAWVGFNFLPRIKKAGFQKCAHIYGRDKLARLTAESMALLLDLEYERLKIFRDKDKAVSWLLARPEQD